MPGRGGGGGLGKRRVAESKEEERQHMDAILSIRFSCLAFLAFCLLKSPPKMDFFFFFFSFFEPASAADRLEEEGGGGYKPVGNGILLEEGVGGFDSYFLVFFSGGWGRIATTSGSRGQWFLRIMRGWLPAEDCMPSHRGAESQLCLSC